MSRPDISVVLPVHSGVQPAHLRRAVESINGQTLSAGEVVLVEDGPVSNSLRSVIEEAHDLLPLRLLVLPVNRGAGVANQAGLEAARGDWVAKADADDINAAERFFTQRTAVDRDRIDLCGAAMLEFVGDESDVRSVRSSPVSHEAIGRRMGFNNPINHPTAFFRRTVALEVGGYPAWRYMQDYGLFARMYAGGAQMMNLPEPLVRFRSGSAVTRRRRSREIRRTELVLQRELRDLRLIGTPRMIANVGWRSAYRLLPGPAVSLVSRRFLARPLPPSAVGDQ